MTEFKWYEGIEVHRLYLSAILDLCDRRIVSHVLSEHNDNPQVYKTFDKAVKANPNAHPCFTVIEGSNTRAKLSTTNFCRLE